MTKLHPIDGMPYHCTMCIQEVYIIYSRLIAAAAAERAGVRNNIAMYCVTAYICMLVCDMTDGEFERASAKHNFSVLLKYKFGRVWRNKLFAAKNRIRNRKKNQPLASAFIFIYL